MLISYPMVTGTDVWWQEGRPDEGGRVTVVHCDAGRSSAGHAARAVERADPGARIRRAGLPAGARPAAGTARTAAAGQAIVFANYADQRLYLAGARGRAARAGARPLSHRTRAAVTPPATGDGRGLGALRFADFILSADGQEVWCVQERHEGGKITRSLVAVPLDGSAAEDPGGYPRAGQRLRFFRLPDVVPGWEPAGLDLLEPPADALGRDRIAGGPDFRRGAGARAAG